MARTPSTKPATRKPAASAKVGTTVTKDNLKALGADRLADLLVELSEQDAVLTRKLRMALTATHAKDKLGKEIEKRLRTIQRSRGFLPWDRIKPLAAELDTLRRSTLDDVATMDIGQAISAMRVLVELAPSVYARLVREHTAELDGRDYGTLRPAADRLSESYPNEATLLYRLLVEAVLDKALSRYYSYAAKDLASCRLLALMLTTADGMESHEAFMTRLKSTHTRKLGFWSLIGEE